jgi:hypothetical protein
MTVFGEVTKAGAESPPPSAQSPLYYLAQSGGYNAQGSLPGEKLPLADAIDLQVRKALQTAGYRAVEGDRKPDIIVIFHWGSEQQRDRESVRTRAVLVGGESFANEAAEAMNRESQHRETQKMLTGRQTILLNDANRQVYLRNSGPGSTAFGLRQQMTAGIDFAPFSPLEQFKRKDENNAMLLEQIHGGLYYVIISAYDHDAMAKGKRVLLWRTRLTVDSTGVSFSDTMPALLANAAPYLGRDTGRPGTFSKKMLRTGTVHIGEATVVEEDSGKADHIKSVPATNTTP